jgi:hypothetical protein
MSCSDSPHHHPAVTAEAAVFVVGSMAGLKVNAWKEACRSAALITYSYGEVNGLGLGRLDMGGVIADAGG